ncbi:MAG TPA: ADP-dependent glucokinase/phosphofructokinase [Candidatus Norongarragalinales archaeon]|nr:ADP-dependent glucokinase/phosphofructokinase [Candidatus Norongarragalinales archaeon]
MGKEVEAWNKRYQDSRSAKLAKALVAFNSNIDAVVLSLSQPNKILETLDKEQLHAIEKHSDSGPKEIRNETDFYSALLHGIKTGKALHLAAHNNVFIWFDEVFTPDEKRIGGQAGIMANQLAAFNDFVLAYSSLLSPTQATFFNKNVCFPTTKGGKLSCHSAKKAARKEDPTKVNWIFEFKTGEKLKCADEFTSPRSNRLIVSSLVPYAPLFENVDLKQLARHADVAFLAGFQQLHRDKNYRNTLAKIVSQIQTLQNANKKLVVHWEFVPMEEKKIEKEVLLALGKPATSFGLNEVEAVEVLQMLGAKKEAEKIKKNENAYTLYCGCEKMLDAMKMQRVHLHCLGFQLLVLKKPYPIAPEKARDALIFASIAVALKALKGSAFVTRNEVKKHALLPSASGFNQLRALEGGIDEEREKRHSSFVRKDLLESGIFEFNDHYAIIVPAPIVQSKSTVGLGDVISSMALAAERG